MALSSLRPKSILALLILLTTGYAGNYFNLPLFFGLNFLFGSIAVLLVIRFFGFWWGFLAAIVASSWTVVLWNHPYAAIVLVCETLFVGFLGRGKHQNVVLLDVIYWLVIGTPLGWLLYTKFLQLDAIQTELILLKQPVNGIFNALIASLIITYLPIHQWVQRPQIHRTPSLRQILLNLLVAFVFFPALLLIVWDSNRVLAHIENDIEVVLNSTSNNLINNLQNWRQQYLNALVQLGQTATQLNMTPAPELQQRLNLVRQILPDFQQIYVTNAAGEVIASEPNEAEEQVSLLGLGNVNQSILQRTKVTLQPVISNVHIDPILDVPHVDLSVPVVANNGFLGFAYGSLNLNSISQFLVSQLSQSEEIIRLVDSQKQVVASTELEQSTTNFDDLVRNGELQVVNNNMYLWLPPKGKIPTLIRWQKSFYTQEIFISGFPGWKLIVSLSAKPYIIYLQSVYINDLAFMLVAATSAPILGLLFSHHLAHPLTQLATTTTNLPYRLLDKETIKWKPSNVLEIDSLIKNFKLMAIALTDKFQELQNANQNLEQRVKERTDKISQINQDLAIKVIEQQQISAALIDSEEKYRDLFENANDLIQSVTPNGSFLYVNRAWKETLGYSETEIAGLSVSDIIHPNSLPHYQEVFQRIMSGKKFEGVEVAFVSKTGQKIWVEGSINCKCIGGKPIASRAIFRDITERKQAEVEIRNAIEKERNLTELKSRFITTASHEFRTPLTVIFMSAKLLEQFGDHATEEKKRSYLDRIQAATKHMTQLLDDVLIIGKAEAGKLSANLAPLELEKFCRELVEEMQLSADSKHVIIFSSQYQGVVACLDERLLRYILNNLLSNAIKYTPQGGEVKFNLICTDSEAILRIQDQGIGIPKQDQDKLFDSFHRGSNVGNISGTGLGMSIVKQCVDLHNGSITVESEVGVGTTFTVTLPLQQNI